MYSRLSMVLFPIVTLALIGAGFWGYQEHKEKNAILIKAENQYQRAFHDLSYHIDKLHTELGNTLAVSAASQEAYRKGLVNVWRLTSQAQNEINQLPLTLMPFNKTGEFLANTANFSYRAAIRDLSKQPLSQQEMDTLNSLYKHSEEITGQLRDVQGKVIANNLRWMDVETALATQKEPKDNTIIDGFQTVDKKIGEYSELNWGPSVLSINEKRNMQALSGNDLTQDEARKKAAQFAGVPDASRLKVTENGAGTDFQTYTVTIPKPNHEFDEHLDFTKKGGHLISYMNPRNVKESKLSIRQARDIAAQFLDEKGYKDMSAVSYDQYQNVADIVFARRQNDVVIYPEKISVMVALDNGEITGMQAADYVFEHKDRQLPAAKLSAEEAKKALNPKFEISGHSLALIKNDLNEQVLCHEFVGRVNGADYRVYINADTGYQEKIDTLQRDEKEANEKK